MQGFNMGRYYPPDATNPPSFNTSSHPLGKRANKVSQGILTVRFELPFAVWCNHCTPPAIIGQGVRFNAEKKVVGNYYSSPIWSFRMKHSACGGWWEIRTDPKTTEYVVTEGARRRDYGPEDKGAEAEGDLKFLTDEERAKRRDDAFANLEGKVDERKLLKKNKERVEELYDKSEVWRDPYDVNARLRRDFRVKRKVWKKEERHKEGIQEKFSLGLDIADETDADRMHAGLVDFGTDTTGKRKLGDLSWKPLFSAKAPGTDVVPVSTTKKLKVEMAAEKTRQELQHTLVSNTRATLDPFLSKDMHASSKVDLGIRKRKRDAEVNTSAASELVSVYITADNSPSTKPTLTGALVSYESESSQDEE